MKTTKIIWNLNKEEIYGIFGTCDKCNYDKVLLSNKYCGSCGRKIKGAKI